MVICLFNLSLYRLHSPTKKQTNECLYVYSSPFEYWSGIDKCAWRIIEFIWVVFFLSYWFYFVSWTEHKAIYWIDYVLSFKWKCTLNGKNIVWVMLGMLTLASAYIHWFHSSRTILNPPYAVAIPGVCLFSFNRCEWRFHLLFNRKCFRTNNENAVSDRINTKEKYTKQKWFR